MNFLRTVALVVGWLVSFLGAGSTHAQGAAQLEDHHIAVSVATSATGVDELVRSASDAPYNSLATREGLLYQATFESLRPGFQRDLGNQRFALKLATFAVIMDLAAEGRLGDWPAEEDLFSIGPKSLEIMIRSTGMEQDEQLIRRLGSRRPALETPPGNGFYRVLRFWYAAERTQVIAERTDQPWRDLSPEWKVSRRPLSAGEVPKLPVEGAHFAFPLQAFPDLAFAAKSLLLNDLLGSEKSVLRKYLLALAGNALYYMSSGDGTYEHVSLAFLAEFPLRESLRLFREQGAKGQLVSAETIQARLTTVRFYGGNFTSALGDYRRVAEDRRRSAMTRAAAQWGAAICLLALADPGFSAALEKFEDLLLKVPDDHSRKVDFQYALSAVRNVLGVLEGPRQVRLSSRRSLHNADLSRIFSVIDRPDLAVRFWIRVLRELRREEPVEKEIELFYLQSFGASLTDLFDAISWKRVQGRHRPLVEDHEAWVLDFVPHSHGLHRGGCHGTDRYGTCSPEEDRATCGEFYSLPAAGYLTQQFDSLRAALSTADEGDSADQLPPAGAEFGAWAESELAREPANSNPYLKLVWVEWFGHPLTQLQDPRFDLSKWRYEANRESGITGREQAEETIRKVQATMSAVSRRVWQAFSEARALLDSAYGAETPP